MFINYQTRFKPFPAQKGKGFTLIEILVSLLIISVGLLSFALLQAESLKATHTSMQRTKAVSFATDMLERIRANTKAINQYDDANAAPANLNCSDAQAAVNGVNCTPVQMANFDVWDWERNLIFDDATDQRGGIVGGAGSITVTGVNTPYSVSINITWNDRKDANSYTLDTIVAP